MRKYKLVTDLHESVILVNKMFLKALNAVIDCMYKFCRILQAFAV